MSKMNMNSPMFWDNNLNEKITDGAANKPVGSPLTKWKNVDEMEPVKVGMRFRILLVVAGILCLVAFAMTWLSLGDISWAEIAGNWKEHIEDIGSLVIFPMLGVVCFWVALKKRQK